MGQNLRKNPRDLSRRSRITKPEAVPRTIHYSPFTNHELQPYFLQNKPNLREAQMNVTSVRIANYEENRPPTPHKNKPNSNPNKPNFPPPKMSIWAICTNPGTKQPKIRPNFPPPKLPIPISRLYRPFGKMGHPAVSATAGTPPSRQNGNFIT